MFEPTSGVGRFRSRRARFADHRRPITTAAALPSAQRTELITYLSEGADGRPALVSGTVAIPKGEAPESGWPVISWAHGTTGVGDACAPSADTVGGPAHSYVERTTDMLDRWVADGYAVVQTDYEASAPRVNTRT